MAAITIRGLSNDTHRALKARAAAHHRSTEAEVRAILDASVADAPPDLAQIFESIRVRSGGIPLKTSRDQTPVEPPDFA